MGQVTVQIGGRGYPLACRDGEEAHLVELAAMFDAKTGQLGALGTMSETRLLLMAGLLLADEISDLRKVGTAASNPRMAALALRLEALASKLDDAAA